MNFLENYEIEVLTLSEAATAINVPESDLIAAIDNNQLPATKIGNNYFIKITSLKKFLTTPNRGVKINPKNE
jgi:excisionase family DNA binding protein